MSKIEYIKFYFRPHLMSKGLTHRYFYCHRFRRRGAECIGIDILKLAITIRFRGQK
jgi:hypothetical protein